MKNEELLACGAPNSVPFLPKEAKIRPIAGSPLATEPVISNAIHITRLVTSFPNSRPANSLRLVNLYRSGWRPLPGQSGQCRSFSPRVSQILSPPVPCTAPAPALVS